MMEGRLHFHSDVNYKETSWYLGFIPRSSSLVENHLTIKVITIIIINNNNNNLSYHYLSLTLYEIK